MADDNEGQPAFDDAALRELHRMDVAGQVAAGAAHEFNNLLQGIGGSLQMLRRRLEQGRPQDAERLATAAMLAVDRATELTRRLHVVTSRASQGRLVLDPAALVFDLAELARMVRGRAVQVTCEAAAGVWPVECDPGELQTVLLGVCLDARDAMPLGGQLTISATNEVDGAGREVVALAVRGCGHAVPPGAAAAPSAVLAGWPTAAGPRWTALQGVAQACGGTIRVEEAAGGGTTVALLLPPADATHCSAGRGDCDMAGAARGG